MIAFSSSWSKGLARKSNAPAFIASTALSIFPCAVITITGTSGWRATTLRSRLSPSMRGMTRSVTTTSAPSRSRDAMASSPSAQTVTS